VTRLLRELRLRAAWALRRPQPGTPEFRRELALWRENRRHAIERLP
jgi:hypothetical protein